jgi:hypothetical protein
MANCTEAANGSLADRDADDDIAVLHAPGYGVDEQRSVTFRSDAGAAAAEVAILETTVALPLKALEVVSCCIPASTAAASVARASTVAMASCHRWQLVLPCISIVPEMKRWVDRCMGTALQHTGRVFYSETLRVQLRESN